jgi:hypothetical protein
MGSTGRSLPNVLYFVASCAISILLCSCGSSTKSLQLAEQNVDRFHAELDSGQYTAAYAASDEKFHQATTEPDFVKLLDAVHGKLGSVQKAKLRHESIMWFSGQGATVTLVYDTKFAEGIGTEQFVWHVTDNGAALYSYHINSNELVIK